MRKTIMMGSDDSDDSDNDDENEEEQTNSKQEKDQPMHFCPNSDLKRPQIDSDERNTLSFMSKKLLKTHLGIIKRYSARL